MIYINASSVSVRPSLWVKQYVSYKESVSGEKQTSKIRSNVLKIVNITT